MFLQAPRQDMSVLLTVGVLVLLVIAIDLGLLVAWLFNRVAVAAERRPPIFSPKWSLVHVWIAAQVIVGGLIAFVIAFFIVVALFGGGRDLLSGRDSAVKQFYLLIPISLLVQNALCMLVPAWFITQLYRQPLSSIGFSFPIRKEEARKGFLWGFGLLVVGLGFQVVFTMILYAIFGPSLMRSLEQTSKEIGNEQIISQSMANPGMFLIILIGAGVLAPLGEEFFFRGFLYNALKRRWHVGAATILSAIIFALVHAGPLLILAIIPVGILLAMAYERSRSLWVTIIMHATFNSTQLIAAYFLTRAGH